MSEILREPPLKNVTDVESGTFKSFWYKWFSSVTKFVNEGQEASAVTEIDSNVGIRVISTLMRVISSTSGNVDITANPQVSKGFDRQTLTIEGNSDIKTVQLDNGNGLDLKGGTMILGEGDVIGLHYNAVRSVWIENYRNN